MSSAKNKELAHLKMVSHLSRSAGIDVKLMYELQGCCSACLLGETASLCLFPFSMSHLLLSSAVRVG